MSVNTNPKCSKCYNYWKPDDDDIKSSGLPYKTCKKCRIYNKNYHLEKKNDVKSKKQEYYNSNKTNILKKAKDYYDTNLENIKKRDKLYREKNYEKIKTKKKITYEKNKDKILQQKKEYYQKNKDKINDRNNEYSKTYFQNMKKNNISFYLIRKQSQHLHRIFNISNLTKNKSSVEYLGCDVTYFKSFLQNKMDNWNKSNEIKMTWNDIHLDHIKPVSKFQLEDEEDFLSCCHYTNFQPLLVEDNLSKHNKWTITDEIYWNENIKNNDNFFSIYNVK